MSDEATPSPAPIWVIDTSAIIEVRRSATNHSKPGVFQAMTDLVSAGRLVFPPQVLEELKRRADQAAPDPQFQWAAQNSAVATSPAACSFDEVKAVLARVPTVLDPHKDSGAEEADPYVLAAARRIQQQGKDCRVVTEDLRDRPRKMSLSTAAGVLGIPSVPLKAFLTSEGISYE